jgi:hypothetical protein
MQVFVFQVVTDVGSEMTGFALGTEDNVTCTKVKFRPHSLHSDHLFLVELNKCKHTSSLIKHTGGSK